MNPLSQLRDRFLMNERFSAAVNAVIIVVMMACVATVTIQVGQRLVPEWQGAYWGWAALAVAIESVISVRVASKLRLSTWGWALYHITELIFIFAAVKLYSYTRAGLGQLWADLPRWQHNFNTFFDGEYLFAAVLNGGIWLGCWTLTSTALEMEGDAFLMERDHGIIEGGRTAARQRLGGQVFGIGALLLILVAILRSNLNLLGISSPALQTSLTNVLVYFVLGLLLFSQAHFAVLRATWSLEHIKISPNMAQRWTAYSVAMLAGVGLVVAVLPTRYSLGLLGTLSYLLGVVTMAMMTALALALALIAAVMSWLASLFGTRFVLPPSALPTPPPPPPPVAPAGPPIPWLDVMKSVAFWAVFLAVVGYSVFYYLSQRKGVAAFLRRTPFYRWLLGAWRLLRGGVRGLNQMVVAAVQEGLRRLRPAPGEEPWRYLNVRNLAPRDRVRFFYQALLRRGAESGLPRRPSETPYEYENDLNVSLPETQDNLAGLTEGFMEARYSEHPISPEAADGVRRHWEHVRQALRKRREKKKP